METILEFWILRAVVGNHIWLVPFQEQSENRYLSLQELYENHGNTAVSFIYKTNQ